MALIPIGALAPACSSSQTQAKGQLITCTTAPGTGLLQSQSSDHLDIRYCD